MRWYDYWDLVLRYNLLLRTACSPTSMEYNDFSIWTMPVIISLSPIIISLYTYNCLPSLLTCQCQSASCHCFGQATYGGIHHSWSVCFTALLLSLGLITVWNQQSIHMIKSFTNFGLYPDFPFSIKLLDVNVEIIRVMVTSTCINLLWVVALFSK